CLGGQCVDCTTTGCSSGQVCSNHLCITDPCASVQCGANEACFNGTCQALCDDRLCPDGEHCSAQGQCVAIGCNPACTPGQFCDSASSMCRSDMCAASQTRCPTGMVCISGQGCVTN